MAAEILQKRQRRRRTPAEQQPGSQPVFGMPGRRFTPGQGVQ
jgi:hypothetical protein